MSKSEVTNTYYILSIPSLEIKLNGGALIYVLPNCDKSSELTHNPLDLSQQGTRDIFQFYSMRHLNY